MSHEHRWSYFYVPGDAYRYCTCGATETVSPDGEHGPVPAKEQGFVKRHIERLEKSAEALKKTLGPFTFEIDRPEGTTKEWPGGKKFTYPVDYGFFPNLTGEDGEGLDAFVGDNPEGHLESFQKLKPNKDGKLVADETKYLLGVSDRQRETIYKLYGQEINARRVYDSWDEVEKSLDRFEKEAAATDGPANLLGLVGTPQYYLSRAADFRRRHPDLRAPDYYNEYGDRYAHRFENQTRPRLSPAGKAWFDKTKHGLQYAIEQKRVEDPQAFDALERDPKAFHRFAYDTHGPVYLSSGIRKLPLRDLMHVARTPDIKDVINRDGLRLVGQVLNPFNKAASVKEARVPTHVKQYRRALQMLAQGDHDFHGTDNLSQVVDRGRVVGGPRDVFNTGGKAYFSRGVPLDEYFDPSYRRDGGFAFPKAHMDAAGGTVIPQTQGHPVQYTAARNVPLKRGASVIATSPDGAGAASVAQRRFRMRRIDAEPFQLALETARGNASPGEAQHILKNLDGPYVPANMSPPSPSPVSLTTSPVSQIPSPSATSVLDSTTPAKFLTRRNAAIAGGTLATAAALYGGHRWLRSRREKAQEKAAGAFDGLNWVPTPYQGRIQTPQEIVYSARSTPALAATQENIRMLQIAQDPYGTGSPTQGVAHHRRHYR